MYQITPSYVLAGDFETGAMLERIRELLRPDPGGVRTKSQRAPRTTSKGERRITVEGPGETIFLQIAHRTPAASNPDLFPITVLDSLLTGPSNLNMFGGGISNKTSRLYRALVEKELAVSVHGGLQATIDPFLHSITGYRPPSSSIDAVLAAIDAEIEQVQSNPPPAEELQRAVKQARALFAYGSESITNQAFWMGFTEMFANYEWFETYLEKLAAVTPEDIQRVAREYFRKQNRTIGIYQPTIAQEGQEA